MNNIPNQIIPHPTAGDLAGRPPHRRGVTLMETIFAMAVILTGLVGVAALIPIAANNAQSALELDRSVSESTSSAALGLVQSFNDTGSLVIFDKPTAGSTGHVVGEYGYAPSSAMRTVQWKVIGQSNTDPPINASSPPSPFIVLGKLESPGYGHTPLGAGLTSGICIDPLGIPNPTYYPPSTGASNSDSAFDYSRFPYYGERYNALAPPNDPIGGVAGPGGANGKTPAWPMSPRMWRATLKSPIYSTTTTNPVFRHHLMPSKALRNIFEGSGGLSPIEGNQKGDPRSVLVSRTQVGGNYVDSARDNSSSYTWFATLALPFLGGNTFRQSIVVVRQRLSPVPRRANDPMALQKNSYTAKKADDNPPAERLTWINPSEVIGFNGGAGGEVRVYGSNLIDDELTVGQWVMLSRQPHTLSPVEPTGPAVHRWFRVVRADDAQYVNAYSWPGGTHNVWRRWVALAGPDWAFEDGVGTPVDDTFCTIVTGAVSVVESDVVLQ